MGFFKNANCDLCCILKDKIIGTTCGEYRSVIDYKDDCFWIIYKKEYPLMYAVPVTKFTEWKALYAFRYRYEDLVAMIENINNINSIMKEYAKLDIFKDNIQFVVGAEDFSGSIYIKVYNGIICSRNYICEKMLHPIKED